MKRFKAQQAYLAFMLILSVFIIILPGCGGGGGGHWDEPGPTDTTAPRVTAVVPLNNATGVAINTKRITAAFSEAMDESTITTATFTVKETVSGTSVAGTVTYVQASRIATFAPTANLVRDTQYTATITTGAKNPSRTSLESPFEWTFRTGVTEDTTRPRVTVTVPANAATDVATNTAITAVFTEDMDPTTITGASFTVVNTTLGGTAVAGDVTYAVAARTATFTPTTPATLLANNQFTATITTTATDLAGNQLAGNQASLPAASNYVWTFTTAGAPAPPGNISVSSTNPAAGAGAVCSNTSINATFSVPSGLRMEPLSVAANFTVTGPGATSVPAASVVLDVLTGRIATFTPINALTSGVLYTATIKGGATGVKDLAIPANTMASDFTWTFTAGPATVNCPAPIALGPAAPFGVLTAAAITGSTAAPTGTTVNGDIGTVATSTSITNFVGGGPPATPGIVNGTIYASNLPLAGDTTSLTARNYLLNTVFPAAIIVGATGTVVPTSDLGAQTGFGPVGAVAGTFLPGVYTSGSSIAISTPIYLDAQGNGNAVWIFYMPSSTLTTTGLGNVNLINGAQEKNVFWVVGSTATISTAIFKGNILAGTSINVDTVAVTVDGRLLASAATSGSITFDAHLHTVNVPAP